MAGSHYLFPFLASFIALVAVFLLPLAPPWLLRRSPTLRNVFLARPWRRLLALDRPLLWLWPLILSCRTSLLRWGLRWG